MYAYAQPADWNVQEFRYGVPDAAIDDFLCSLDESSDEHFENYSQFLKLVENDLDNITHEQCRLIVQSCFKSHHEKMLSPFANYQRLLHMYQLVEPMMADDEFHYLSAQYKADLLVWYHLAWTGESLRQNNEIVKSLLHKGMLFTMKDRKQLFNVIGDTISGLIPRYKALLKRKQIEISTTPHYHPILPLLLDFKSTLDAMPYAPLPKNVQYKGGRERAIAHVASANLAHKHFFGVTPRGMWPAECAVSFDSFILLAALTFFLLDKLSSFIQLEKPSFNFNLYTNLSFLFGSDLLI
jgi:alpha-amylase/alpha-mannosidase (GH57 family)